MHQSIRRTEMRIAAAVLALGMAPLAGATAQENPLSPITTPFEALNNALDTADASRAASEKTKAVDRVKVTLVVGRTTSVTFDDWVTQVKIDNQELVEVVVPKGNLVELRMQGLKPGLAEILVTDRAGNQKRLDVTITQDVSPLQETLSRICPDSNIQVIPATDQSAVVTGFVENAQAVPHILEVAKQYYPNVINDLKVVGPQQVQLRVMIAEVSRTKLRSLGFNFLFADTNGGTTRYFTSTVGGLTTVSRDTAAATGIGFTFTPDNNFTYGRLTSDREFRGFLRALKTEGVAKIIAEPTIIAFSGRAAKMNIGGEFPVLIPDSQGKVTIEFREFGNKVDVTPIVLGGGRIRLEVRPELSDRDDSLGVTFAGFVVPGIKTRYVDTCVELNTGESFVIGGLLSTTNNATTNKVPYLGDLAIIGAAFRTVSYDVEEKELIIMVTPELVEPIRASQKPCSHPGSEAIPPSNGELFFNGQVESPPCTACEIARRQQLRAQGGSRRCTGVHTEGDKAAGDGQADKGVEAAEAALAREAQRPSSLPELLGPLGYDAGR